MRIKPKITIRTFLKKKAKTLSNLTLGETEINSGEISIFAGQISVRAMALKHYFPKYSAKQLIAELYYLVLFHELHHALAGSKDTERAADKFSWHCFKDYFGRKTFIPMRFWRDLPSK